MQEWVGVLGSWSCPLRPKGTTFSQTCSLCTVFDSVRQCDL